MSRTGRGSIPHGFGEAVTEHVVVPGANRFLVGPIPNSHLVGCPGVEGQLLGEKQPRCPVELTSSRWVPSTAPSASSTSKEVLDALLTPQLLASPLALNSLQFGLVRRIVGKESKSPPEEARRPVSIAPWPAHRFRWWRRARAAAVVSRRDGPTRRRVESNVSVSS